MRRSSTNGSLPQIAGSYNKGQIKVVNNDINWFRQARFGMFVHWGIYAVPGVHEQYWQRWNLQREAYIKYADQFNPVKFDPVEWLDMAQDAGMEYMCFTTKHHDGFCMWDTRQTDFNIMNTPYKRDIVGMLAEECHKRNFPLMLYYSVVDWHQQAYPTGGIMRSLPTRRAMTCRNT